MNKKQNAIPDKRAKQNIVLELSIILGACVVVYIFSAYYDILERIVEFSKQHENWELDEIITVSIFLVASLAFFSIRRWRELQASERDLIHRNEQLQKALSEIKQLKKIIPICASCKNVRDDEGFWSQVESYIHKHTGTEFSHGMCPECMEKWYPDFIRKKNKGTDKPE